MYLYLVQHGEAKREEEYPARGLTKKRIDDVLHVTAALREMNVPMSRILHSGKNSSDTCPILRNLREYSSAEIKKRSIEFKIGGVVCCKRVDDGRWAIEWMIVPEMVK